MVKLSRLLPIIGTILFAGGNFLFSLYIQQSSDDPSLFARFALLQVLLGASSNFLNGFSTIPLTLHNTKNGISLYLYNKFIIVISIISPFYATIVSLGMSEGDDALSMVVNYSVLIVLYNMRWFIRGIFISEGKRNETSLSDFLFFFIISTYSVLGYFFLEFDYERCLSIYSFAVFISISPFYYFIIRVIRFKNKSHESGIIKFLKENSTWSTLTVILSDFGSNSHVYSINYYFGNSAFAPIALASMIVRPIGVIQTSVIQVERYSIFKIANENNTRKLLKLISISSSLILFVCLLYMISSYIMINIYPNLILRGIYSYEQVVSSFFIMGGLVSCKIIREPILAALQRYTNFAVVANMTGCFSFLSIIMAVASLKVLTPNIMYPMYSILACEIIFTIGAIIFFSSKLNRAKVSK